MHYSIIIPTYNSERWIKSCVNSVLVQTLTTFNIIIVDSGSTDGTLDWLRSLKDHRIIIHPTDKRLGIAENWGRITGVPKNEFMTILGHDDVLYPNYLETIDDLMKQFPDAGLYQTHFNFIDAEGEIIKACKPMAAIISPHELLRQVLQNSIVIVATGFMMRSKEYDALGGIPLYPNLLYADFTLWLSAIDKRYLAVSPATCFAFRFHAANTSKIAEESRLSAFEKMIYFFKTLADEDEQHRNIVQENVLIFMKRHVTGACHKLIYVPKENRGTLTMEKIIGSAKKCMTILAPDKNFEPDKFPGIIVAKMIDSNMALRKLFLFYKSFSKRTF